MFRIVSALMIVVAFALLAGVPILSVVSEAAPLTLSMDPIFTLPDPMSYSCSGGCR